MAHHLKLLLFLGLLESSCVYGMGNETSETDCGNETLIETHDYIYFETLDADYEMLNGFYYRDDSLGIVATGLPIKNEFNETISVCEDGIICNETLHFYGTYIYGHESGDYFMYEYPSVPYPRIYISDEICSNNYIVRSDILPSFGYGTTEWVLAVKYSVDFEAPFNDSDWANSTFNYSTTNNDQIEWFGYNNGNETRVLIYEYCDMNRGLISSCLAPNYTYPPTVDLDITSFPTQLPTVPTYQPTLPTSEPTMPTYEPTMPTYSPTPPTYSPSYPTNSPIAVPTQPTYEPTLMPTVSACPNECSKLNNNHVCECSSDEYCEICHANGCNLCKDGYFKKDYNYPCVSCNEWMGKGCNFCQDFNGCGECDFNNGYTRRYCDSCDLWICTTQCYSFTERKFDEQYVIGQNKFIATLNIEYEDVGCTNLKKLNDVKVFLLIETQDVSKLKITLSHENIEVIVQDCSSNVNCQEQENEIVLLSSSNMETNGNNVCQNCQISDNNERLWEDNPSFSLQGVYAPSASLNAFKNTHATGQWTLTIEDSSEQSVDESMTNWIYEYAIHICPKWNQ